MSDLMNDSIGMSFGTRLHTPEFAKPRSPAATFCRPQWQRIGFGIVLFILLGCSAATTYAADNLECPEIGPGWVPDLIGDATGSGLVTTENRVELANEINYSINRLQTSHPNISSADVQNVLIAAYCRVVAHAPGLNASERWSRMRQPAFWNSKLRPTRYPRETDHCEYPSSA